MRKLVLFIFMFLCVPFVMNAESYVPEKLSDSLKAEGINIDIGDYKYSDDKVNVYLFRGQGCGHCEHFLEFVSSTLVKEYGDYFNFIGYETWKNDDNNSLMQKVKDSLGVTSKGVPFIVIGDSFFVGYGESRNEAIVNLIKSEYENKDRVDIVKKLGYGDASVSNDKVFSNVQLDNKDDDINSTQVNGNFKDEVDNSTNSFDYDILIIVGVVLGAMALMIYVIMFYLKIKKNN